LQFLGFRNMTGSSSFSKRIDQGCSIYSPDRIME
jgi:hypothetical protein